MNTNAPLKVGITGGIGSGKTTVCKLFELLGIPVYYSDDRAKTLMTEQEDVRRQIQNTFGRQSYLQDGSLDRTFLAKQVFSNPEMLEKLNGIVHPAVFRDAAEWFSRQEGVPFALKEAALLVESGSFRDLDKLIVVTAPEELRIRRVMERDGIEEAAVRARMKNQLPEHQKVELADFVLHNDGRHSLIRQVWELYHQLIRICEEGSVVVSPRDRTSA